MQEEVARPRRRVQQHHAGQLPRALCQLGRHERQAVQHRLAVAVDHASRHGLRQLTQAQVIREQRVGAHTVAQHSSPLLVARKTRRAVLAHDRIVRATARRATRGGTFRRARRHRAPDNTHARALTMGCFPPRVRSRTHVAGRSASSIFSFPGLAGLSFWLRFFFRLPKALDDDDGKTRRGASSLDKASRVQDQRRDQDADQPTTPPLRHQRHPAQMRTHQYFART